jgi:hypothetical protein
MKNDGPSASGMTTHTHHADRTKIVMSDFIFHVEPMIVLFRGMMQHFFQKNSEEQKKAVPARRGS